MRLGNRFSRFLPPWMRVTVLAGLLFAGSTSFGGDLQFNRDVRPILSEKCFACHGLDPKSRQGELRLDVAEGALKSKDGTPAIVPHDPAASELWKRVSTTNAEQIMPPLSSKKALTEAEKATLQKWIEQGAIYQKHWAFEPPVAPMLPSVKNEAWMRNPIDRFILANLESKGLEPLKEADRSVLIRRVSFALTGLPPSLSEVETFLNDPSPDAYELMVDRYLQSARYGEEMARHWLDVARYADTHGQGLDNDRSMWLYRDWVINSFNQDQPFDEFTVEQIAGDLLTNPSIEQLVATGFNRCNVTTSENGTIPEEFLYRYAVERTSTVIEAWLGLTGGCAVCHDHKFDPLSMKEFYSLYAFFYSAADPATDGNIARTTPFLKVPSPAQKEQLAAARLAEEEALKRYRTAVSAEMYEEPKAGSAKRLINDVWLRDFAQAGVKSSSTTKNPPVWTIDPPAKPPYGRRVLVQQSSFVVQDRFESSSTPQVVPEKGIFYAWVLLDPQNSPKGVMLEFVGASKSRAVWGEFEDIGTEKTTASTVVNVGKTPPPGKWTRLEVSADALGLRPGEIVKEVALAQYGGIAFWDGVEVSGECDPTKDPRQSFRSWMAFRSGGSNTGGSSGPGQGDAPAAPTPLAPTSTQIDSGWLIKLLLAASVVAISHLVVQRRKPKGGWILYIGSAVVVLAVFYSNRKTSGGWDDQHTSFKEDILRDHGDLAKQYWQDYTNARIDSLVIEDSIPGTFIFKDIIPTREAYVMLGGQYDQRGEKVSPMVPAVFPPLEVRANSLRPDRLDLARWLVADSQPTTSRVTVNRFWQQIFGTGLVKSSFDFGSQGDPPSHPELLDWLAISFRENGWNVKALVRLMVTSQAFRQSSKTTPDAMARDPENRFFARGPRIRLDAEQIRDNALFVSGLMNFTMGGRGVKPYQPANIWEPVGNSDSNTRYYLQDHGDALYRRSIYCYLKRTAPPPFMSNFDGPNREQFCTRRDRTNTPLQALQVMNDVQHVEAARAFADRILAEGGKTATERITYAYRVALARAPRPEELPIIERALGLFLERYQNDQVAANALVHSGESKPRARNRAELAAYTLVANMILSLDEVMVRN